MSFALAEKVAAAVLYEGYVLYPYRASAAKNRVRFQFGVVAPREHAETGGSEPWQMQTECLVAPATGADPGIGPHIDLEIRFLQLQARIVEEALDESLGTAFRPVEFLDLGGEFLVSWDEGLEQQLEISGIALRELLQHAEPRLFPLVFPGGTEVEELRGPAGDLRGRLVRRREAISARVLVSAEALERDLLRVRVRIENLTPCPPPLSPDSEDWQAAREEALRCSLVSAHTLLAVQGGSFVSLLDPPAEAAEAAAGCANLHTWPVLIGPEGSRDVMLSSPIILYDYPAIAPESPGDLCDATEIDEILTLRVMTLTDEEKREARGTDPRARRIVENADSIPREILERLHGAVRSLAPAEEPTPDPVAGDGYLPVELASWETFLNPPGEAPPEDATIEIASVLVSRGSRVRLQPSRRADAMDLFLAGRLARVEGIYRDVDGGAYVAVKLDDDLAADLAAAPGRFLYFYPDEVEPLIDGALPETALASSRAFDPDFAGPDSTGPDSTERRD